MKTHAGRKLSRKTGHRISLLRNMTKSLLHHEKIQTTVPKAKEVSRFAEQLITTAKRNSPHARRLVARDLHDPVVTTKLFDVLISRYKNRPGGYTQIIHLGPRLSDGAEMGILKLVS